MTKETFTQELQEYRPHRLHHCHCSDLQDFLAGGITGGDRPSEDGYRPPRQIPPADRSPGNEAFCGAFSSPLVIAVGAVGILTRIYLPQANHVLMRTINTQF